jgi:transcriptional regulator with XRE-family HTH domain
VPEQKRKMPGLKAIVDAHREAHGSSEAWISDKIGLDRRGLWSWWNRGLTQMPSPYLLHNLARTLQVSYRDVLDAALADFDYLPEASAAQSQAPARIKKATGRKVK